MKVGDIVRKTYWSDDLGVVVEQQGDGDDGLGMYWRALFDGDLIYLREADLEVISESR